MQKKKKKKKIQRWLGPDAVLAQSWDANHQLTSQSVHSAAGQQVARRSYSYRADGMLTGVDDELSGPRRFDLDRGGRVTGVRGHGWDERYAYDAAGNVTSASWPVGQSSPEAEPLGEREYSGTLVQRAGRVTYKHDSQGRVVFCQRKRLSRKPETWRYFWDSDDRLVGVLTPDGTNWRYRYDPLGRRTSKQRLSPDGTRVLEQVDFTWDGVVLAEQAHSDGIADDPQLGDAHVTVWDYEPGTFRPLTQTERAPLRHAPQQWIDQQFHSIITDLVGTPTELVNDHGGIDWFHRTTLWGNTSTQGGTASTPLRFPGQYYDPETGLHYNLHRHYDPTSGRYTSGDPLGLAAGPNPHRYVANPHELIDPLGLAPCPVGRKGAFNEAKRDAGIPRSQQPDSIRRVFMKDRDGRNIIGDNGHPIMTREYTFSGNRGDPVTIQDHTAGHDFGEGGVGNQGPHFNVRPPENTRTGSVPGTQDHYPFNP